MESVTEVFWWGVLGGFFAEFSIWLPLSKKKEDLPDWFFYWFYWLVVVVKIFIGGVLAMAYQESSVQLSPILSINIGASAPLLLSKFAHTLPDISPGKIDTSFENYSETGGERETSKIVRNKK